YVNNTSGVSDSFDLASSTVSSFASLTLPAGWTVVFTDQNGTVITNTGSINASGSKLVNADVTIPAGQAPGTTDLFFRALSPTSGASDRLHDAATINTVR